MPKRPKRAAPVEEEEDDAAEARAEELALQEALAEREAAASEGADGVGDEGSSSYDRAGLELACRSVETNLPWLETLDIAAAPLAIEDAHDDLQREVAFYGVALAAVKEGRARLSELGVPFRRPDDYFCEMLKSDAHMAKVKDRLIFEQQKMAAFEQRKSQQERRKFSRAVQAEREGMKARAKKENIERVQAWRKESSARRGKGAVAALGDRDDGFEDHNQRGRKRKAEGAGGERSPKRAAKDKKYGFGGRKKFAKSTDAASLNDFRDFRPSAGKSSRRGGGSSGGKPKGKGANRPGKDARAAKRASLKKN